jgi:hypothetical protein
VLGAEVFVPRAGLSARQTSVPPRRCASPIAEGLNGLPKAAPSDSTSRSLQTPAPVPFSLGRSAKPLRPKSPRARDSAADSERRFLLCAHNAHLWPWSTLEHSSPIEDACTSSWESHRWVLPRGFSSSRTSRAGASVVSNGPTRDSTPARDGLVIARTQPTSRRATKEESPPACADVLTVRLTASQSSPVTSNEQI